MDRGEQGLAAAIRAAGGKRALARKLGIDHKAVCGWRRVPEARLYEVARLTGVAAEDLRPDLAASVRIVRQQEALARARERHRFGGFIGRATAADGGKTPVDLFELGLVVAAVRFAAEARALHGPNVMHGLGFEDRSARAYGMALAHVVGRVSSSTIALVLGGSRQNVENASERYLRARDGDDEDDIDAHGYVIERGRLRRPKGGDEALWTDEQRFIDWLEGNL